MKKSTYLFALALGASTLTFAQVGIGTSTPSSPLDIEASDAAIDINNTAADGDPAINFQLSGTTTFSIGIDDGDSDKFKIGTSGIGTNTRMTIDGSGKVGIGTTNPNGIFQVFNNNSAAEALTISAYDGTSFINTNLNSDAGVFQNAGDCGIIFSTDGTNAADGNNGFFIRSWSAINSRGMIIMEDGSVGIGANQPGALLDVDGDAIFNESGADKDFRIESDANTHHFYVDGTNNEIGVNTSSPASTIDIQGSMGLKVTTITSATTLDQTHNVVLCNTGAYTVTLPAAATNTGKVYYIKNIDTDSDDITIDGNALETIDGATTVVLYVYKDAIRIVSDGSNWHIIADERIPHSARLTRNTTQTITTATWTTISLNNQDYDVGEIADPTTNNRIDIKRTGSYLVSYEAHFDLDDTENLLTRILVNGSAGKSYNFVKQGSNGFISSGGTITISLTAGDYIELDVQHTDGVDADNLTAGGYQPSISILEIR